jgi:uncharacterized membrane protein affecting hemolysin expression
MHLSNLIQLYQAGKFLMIPNQYTFVKTALASWTANACYLVAKLDTQNLTTVLQNTFGASILDAMIYAEQKILVVKLGSPPQAGHNEIPRR